MNMYFSCIYFGFWFITDKNLSGKTLNSIGMSRHFELLYNMGIQLLHCGKAMPAFDCLVEAVQVFRSNPRLWLRLAECCIMANRQVLYT